VFLGKDLGEHRDYGPRTEELIDSEVDRLLQEGRENAERIITEQREHLNNISKFLIENETIDGKQMIDIVEGRNPAIAIEAVSEEVSGEDEKTESPPNPSPENHGRTPDIRDANPQPGLD